MPDRPDLQTFGMPYPVARTSTWDRREDGSAKGNGFLGVMARPDGRVSSEISIPLYEQGDPGDPGYRAGPDVPTMVPTLDASELQLLLRSADPARENPSVWHGIVRKAIAHARKREAAGQPYFAQPGEENESLYPQFPRVATQGDNGDIALPNTSGRIDPRLVRSGLLDRMGQSK